MACFSSGTCGRVFPALPFSSLISSLFPLALPLRPPSSRSNLNKNARTAHLSYTKIRHKLVLAHAAGGGSRALHTENRCRSLKMTRRSRRTNHSSPISQPRRIFVRLSAYRRCCAYAWSDCAQPFENTMVVVVKTYGIKPALVQPGVNSQSCMRLVSSTFSSTLSVHDPKALMYGKPTQTHLWTLHGEGLP